MDKQKITLEIIALERAALEEWNKGNPSTFLDLYTEDITYFDPMLTKRNDGFKVMEELYEGLRGKVKVEKYEIIDPIVQLYDHIAILTYNLHSYSQGVNYKWNCTEVYHQESDGKWKIVHNHWSFIRPMDMVDLLG